MAGTLRDLEPEARRPLQALIRIMESGAFASVLGLSRPLHVIITSSRRSMDTQRQLWANYQRTGCTNPAVRPGSPRCYPAAPPGRSPHGLGIAIDIAIDPRDQQTRALALAGRLWESIGYRWGGGFSHPDPIHFDVWPRGYTGPK